MPRPRRRVVFGVALMIGLIGIGVVARIGWQWKHALDNVDAMMLPTVILPTSTPEPTQTAQNASFPIGPLAPTLTPQPTSIPEPNAAINVLLLGTDGRPGDEYSRTDAIIVVHVDPKANRVSMLSLPRDLWVKIPG